MATETESGHKPETRRLKYWTLTLLLLLAAGILSWGVLTVRRTWLHHATVSRISAKVQEWGGAVRKTRFAIDRHGESEEGLEVCLARTSVSDDTELEQLKELNVLRARLSLDLSHTRVSDAGVARLKGLGGLMSLNLSNTGITDSGLEHICGLGPWVLDLSHTKITDAGLAHLNGMNLASLNLSDTKVNGSGLQLLKGETKWMDTHIMSLDLSYTQFTDAGLQHLEFLGIAHLTLKGDRITDAGLIHLKALPTLLEVDLRETQVTDTGVQGIQRLLWSGVTIKH
jgi:hypothetical protein